MSDQTKWSIDPSHSTIEFKVKHLMISNVKGRFKTFDAKISTTGRDFRTAEIEVWIDPASVDTGDEKRDEHLKSAEFFDAKNHRQITFVASQIGKTETDGKHDLWGTLTMKGIAKKVKLTVEFGGISKDPWGNEKAGFTVSGQIDRSDWGLVWNMLVETVGLAVSDEVKISAEIELTNSSQKELEMVLEPAVSAAF